MKLVDAASYFDLTEARHPDTGALLFKGQFGPFDDSRRDANAAYRRTLSVRPGTAIPAERTMRFMDVVWLIGAMEPDGLAEVHRQKYVVQQTPLKLSISRLPAFLAGTVASTAWSNPQWVKDAKQLEESSSLPQMFEVYQASVADVRVHDVLWVTGTAYLVLSVHQQSSGFQSSNCLKLDQAAPLAATVTPRTYSPTTGAYTNGTPVAVNALRVRWQSLYAYGSQAEERFQEGDCSVVLPAGTTVTTRSTVLLSGVTYQILSVNSISGAVVLHARPL